VSDLHPLVTSAAPENDASVVIEAVATTEQTAVLELLFQLFPAEERAERLASTLQSVAAGTLSLVGLRQARRGTQRVGAGLSMAQPDGVTLVWPPVADPAVTDPDSVVAAIMSELCLRLDLDGSRMGQVMLDPTAEAERALFERHGFLWRTEVFFLAKVLRDLPEVSPSTSVVETYTPATRGVFAALLEETYQGSQDCPWLEGIRTGEEAVSSHQLSGVFDPGLWSLYRIDDEPAGLCLLNDHPDQDAVELVYFGVSPRFRGRGLGKHMLTQGLAAAAARERAAFFLAVDAQNHFANRLYNDLQFAELASRLTLFRPSARLARQSSTGS
jgi:mycothiol synthase